MVRDSDASSGQTIYAQPVSRDLGANTNWIFVPSKATVFTFH